MLSSTGAHRAFAIETNLLRITARELPPLPDKFGVAGAFATVSGDALIVAGGANFPNGFPWEGGKKVWHNEAYALTRGATNWLCVGAIPHAMAYGVSLAMPIGPIWAGGSDATQHFDNVYSVSWNGSSLFIKGLDPLPMPVANAAGASSERWSIIAGGERFPGTTLAMNNVSLRNHDLKLNLWGALPPLPGTGRTLCIATIQGGQAFVFGGVKLSPDSDGKPIRTYLRDGYAIELRTQHGGHDSHVPPRTWRRIADLPHPIAASPSIVVPVGKWGFAVLGSDDGSKYGFQPIEKHPGFSPEILVYDMGTDRWSSGGVLPRARVTAAAVMWGDEVIIISGEMRPGVRSPEVWAYKIDEP